MAASGHQVGYASCEGGLERHQVAGLSAKFYGNEMNRLARVAVFVRVAFLLQLRHRSALRCQFDHFELETDMQILTIN